MAARPLIHRAFTSTGLPWRPVTGVPSTRASIQVRAERRRHSGPKGSFGAGRG